VSGAVAPWLGVGPIMAQTDFGADEFRARREKVAEAIGDQATAVLQGGARASARSVPQNGLFMI
jgi:hypothetical protein